VAVGTQGLQVNRVVVMTVSVYVVYIQLTAMFRYESAMLASIFLVQGVWILAFLDVSFIDSPAAKATSRSGVMLVADLYLGWTTN
jgi:hypothetical protein